MRKNGKKFNIDSSKTFYRAFAEMVYSSLDELDLQFIEHFPNISGRSGAELIAVILVGQKMFTVVLGDLHCFLTKKIEVIELCHPLNHVACTHPETRR